MTLFRQTYRIESARLAGWNYTYCGWYFVTICVKDRQCVFGEIVDGEMQLSSVGKIVEEEWLKTAKLRSYVMLDAWVLMPNHLHGIIVLEKDDPGAVETSRGDVSETRRWRVSTPRLQPHSLGSIINQFKGAATKRIRTTTVPDFSWQSRFYDHVIRSEKSLEKIREYILNNPMQWEMDTENPDNVL